MPRVRKIWQHSLELSQRLGLARNPDDYWLALGMAKHGRVGLTSATSVTAASKEGDTLASLRRNLANIRDGRRIREFLGETAGY